MIDAATGTLVFDRGTIDKKLTRSAFLNSPLASDAKLILEEEVNRTYQLAQPLHIEKHVVSAQLFFTGESLRAVTLAFIDARFARSWEDWSEAKELGRRDEQNEWLRTLLGGTGPRWQRPWGKVESVSDPKTGGSSIVISYE